MPPKRPRLDQATPPLPASVVALIAAAGALLHVKDQMAAAGDAADAFAEALWDKLAALHAAHAALPPDGR